MTMVLWCGHSFFTAICECLNRVNQLSAANPEYLSSNDELKSSGMKKKGLLKKVFQFVDSAVLGGVFQNKQSSTDSHPTGMVNWPHLIGGVISSVALGVLVYLLATGKISFDEFKEGVTTIKGQ